MADGPIVTAADMAAAGSAAGFASDAVRRHMAGEMYRNAVAANDYYRQQNVTIVSVNLFFTSFAKQARRSRKGGFTGCANVFSPIPVTA